MATFERALLASDAGAAATVATVRAEIEAEIADAFAFALASPFPPAADLLRHTYAERDP